MKKRVFINGAYQTKFGELWDKSLEDLIIEAGEGAMKNAGVKGKDIDLVVVGNKLGGRMSGQDHLGCLGGELLNIDQGIRVEAACASGGVAVHQGVQAIISGKYKKVLVIGVEKMTDKKNGEITEALMGAASEDERLSGLNFAGLYALMARKYMDKFKTKRKDLGLVAVKNHENACFNENAQFKMKVDIEKVMDGVMVAEPLGLFDCSPISDGAAAVVLSKEKGKNSVEVLGSQIAMDTLGLAERKSLVELKATREASKMACREAGIRVDDISIAEVHDCFSIAEIMAYEDLGFCKKGEGFKELKKGKFNRNGKLPVNLSGGLKACGHPVGATGVKQIVELVKQLSGKAGKRQVKKVKIGLAHNVGGTGGTVVVHILRGNYAF